MWSLGGRGPPARTLAIGRSRRVADQPGLVAPEKDNVTDGHHHLRHHSPGDFKRFGDLFVV